PIVQAPRTMLGDLKAIPADTRVLRAWFEFVAAELMSSGDELSPNALAQRFCGGGLPLDGRIAAPADGPAVEKTLVSALTVFERCGLVCGRESTRYTASLRLPVDERVASLTPKGARLAKGSP